MSDILDKSTDLSSDVYGINLYVNQVKKSFTPTVSEETLHLGIFGYMGQMFSAMIQNSIVMASEFSNESIPTKAKFEKNIISHSLGLGITDINAVPATFDVLLTFVEEDIENWVTKGINNGKENPWEFVFDKDTPIYIGDFEFHVDYDIILKKIRLDNSGKLNTFSYTAKYDIDVDNPVSDVTNPYLTSPVRMNVNGKNILFTKCTLRQVEKKSIHKKVLSDNSIASKTVTFDYEGQLAAFTIDVTEGDVTTHLVPTYEGLQNDNRKYPHFYYSYLDSNTIRIKFDRTSYAPRINSDVQINIQTTQGEAGNFVYNPETYPSFAAESEKYGYSNVTCEIRPILGESSGGTDKKGIAELQKLIPKEALSRGSISNLADLENFFNMLNTDNSMLYFYKKRDNALERLYHSFIVMKDNYNVIIPTNTIDIQVPREAVEDSVKQIIKRGQCFRLDGDIGYPTEEIAKDDKAFKYVIPYNFIINTSPLYGMYLLTTIDTSKFLDFSFINENCIYQYIATSISWFRGYNTNPDTYELSITMEQNMDTDKAGDDETSSDWIRCIAVIYDEEDNPIRWSEGYLASGYVDANIFTFKFKFKTEDVIDTENRIEILDETIVSDNESYHLYQVGSKDKLYANFNSNMKCVIHILSKQGYEFGLNGLDEIVPDLDGYSLSNSYTVVDGLDFFYDYSDIVSSTISVNKDETSGQEIFTIKNVPVVKYDYFDNDEGKVIEFAKELVLRKSYIDYATQVLEDAFGMDFKFFNTYGPSKLFKVGDSYKGYLDRTNLSLKFRVKLRANYDINVTNDIISDIKSYIEDINEISTLHMPNLVSKIITTYTESIEYFEFVGINDYDTGVQHIYSLEMPSEVIVPEFINIQTTDSGEPDITLEFM